MENCLQVLDMLGVLTPKQIEAKNRVENYFRRSAKTRVPTLEAFVEQKEKSFDTLLNHFVDARRLKRARRIKDNELKMVRETDDRTEAVIRDYHIIIDLQTRTILHDCADWSRVSLNKQLCKHVGKLLLTMDREKATQILRKLYSQKDTWQFNPYTE